MSDSAAAARALPRTWPERALAALPLAIVFFWLCFIYAWESWGHVSPWLFSDEIKLTETSRAIAAHGHPGPKQPFSLYAYLLAPSWFFSDVHTAYATAKYIGAITMTSVLFPTYGLARLVVPRRFALVAAAAAAAVPALYYSPMLVLEPLAYPYSTFVLYLIAKALVERRRGWIAGAAVAALAAPLVRTQLAVLPAVYLLAAALRFWNGERARRLRLSWSAGDWLGFTTLGLGLFFVASAFTSYHSRSWQVATFFSGRMVQYGLWAAGALTIGLGIVPVVLGLAALYRTSRARRSEAERAFVTVTVAAIVGFGLYTAVKAAYLSAVFSTLVEERNLIYLAPLLFVGTALALHRRRVQPLALVAAAGFALYLILTTPYEMQFHFYSDAPGLAILEAANRRLSFTPGNAKLALVIVLVIAAAAPGVVYLLDRRRRGAAAIAVAVLAALVLAWNVTGEISAAVASNDFSRTFLGRIPDPPNWIDVTTQHSPTLYLGQRIVDPNDIWLTQFWNRSLKYTWSMDGTAPGPGPTTTPNFQSADGLLQQQRGELKYVVLDSPLLQVLGRTKVKLGPWRLVQIDYPVRLTRAIEGFYTDGWMGGRSLYAQFSSAGKRPGWMRVLVSRRGWNGKDVPGLVRVSVGPLRIATGTQGNDLHLASVTEVRTWTIHSGKERAFLIRTPRPPFGVQVTISPTFVPQELDPRIPDRRKLGATVAFRFLARPPR